MTASYKVLLLAGMLLPNLGWAACPAPYDTGTLLDDLVMGETALRKNDSSTAGTVATKIESGLACMNEVMPFMITSRVYRVIGAGKYASGDEARGTQWFLTSLEIDPTYEYGVEDLPATSPIRLAFNSLRGDAETEPIQLSGSKLVDGGTHYLDGSILGGPRATDGRPHLYQWQHDGTVSSWVIQANAFPPEQIEAKVAVVAPAPEPTGKKPKPTKVKPEPAPAPEPAVVEAEPEPAPRPKPVKPAPEPEPEPAVVEAEPEPAPKPKPVKPAPEPEPEPAVAEAEPEPEPKPKPPKPEPTAAPSPKPAKPSTDPGFYARQRPPEKTPLMIGGGVVIAGAGALYGLAWSSRGKFNASQYEDPNGDDKGIFAIQKQTNRLVLLSGVVLGVGAAGLTWGIIVDDGGSPLPAVHFRF